MFEQNNAIHNNSIPRDISAGDQRLARLGGYSAACVDGERMVSAPSAAVADIVVRTIRRGSCAGQGVTCTLTINSNVITSVAYAHINGCTPK